jgi:hypothetical protein
MSRRRALEAIPVVDLQPIDSGDLRGRLKELVREVAPRVLARPRPADDNQEPIPLDPQALIRELRRFLSDS